MSDRQYEHLYRDTLESWRRLDVTHRALLAEIERLRVRATEAEARAGLADRLAEALEAMVKATHVLPDGHSARVPRNKAAWLLMEYDAAAVPDEVTE